MCLSFAFRSREGSTRVTSAPRPCRWVTENGSDYAPGHEGSTVHMVPSGEGFEAEAALPVALTTEAGPAGSPPSIQLSLQPTAAGRFTLWARHEETRPEVPAMLLSAFAALLIVSPRKEG